jgi:hypothetical protein
MKIISKYHDYYDSAMAYGVDTTNTYVRKSYEIEEEKRAVKNEKSDALKPLFNLSHKLPHNGSFIGNPYKEGEYNISTFIIAFCGRAYLGIKVTVRESDGYKDDMLFYTADTYRKYINTEVSKKMKEHFYGDGTDWMGRHTISDKSIDKLFAMVAAFNSPTPFCTLKEPYMLIHKPFYDHVAEINPILKDWQFYKVKDAFAAYQDIDMYLSGVIGATQNPIIEVSNDVKISKHGFDKVSFRSAVRK